MSCLSDCQTRKGMSTNIAFVDAECYIVIQKNTDINAAHPSRSECYIIIQKNTDINTAFISMPYGSNFAKNSSDQVVRENVN